MLCRWPFHQPASRLRLALTRVVDRQGQLVYEYCKSSHWQVEFMLCAICRSTFTRQFSRVLTPGPSSLDFSRESPAKDMWCYVAYVYNGELVSLIGNQWVEIFPPKSKILFVLSLAFKWCRNFQDGTIPVRGDTWTTAVRRKEIIRIIIRIRIKKYCLQGLCFRSNISETVLDIRVPFSLFKIGRVVLPDGTNVVSVVVIVSEI